MTLRDAVIDAATPSAEIEDQVPTREDPAPGPELGPVPVAGSVIEQIRARAHQLQQEQTVELPIPGYNDLLWARYSAVSMSKIYVTGGVAAMPDWRRAADALARACVGLYGRDEDGDLEPLALDVEVRFDDDLCEILGLEPPERTARSVLVTLCGGGELGESRVWSHFMSYQNWLVTGDEGGAAEVTERVLGEYPET